LGGSASFCSKPEYFEFLTNIGTDIVELSGNHNNDYGYQAYLDTLAWYRANNMQTVGGGATLTEAQTPLRLDHNGNRIGWVTCNHVGPFYALASDSAQNPRPGAAACERDWLRTTIDTLKAEGRFVIMTVQYWEFDQHPPTPEQRSDFYFWAGLGADAVIGTQAHFPQTYDFLPRDGAHEAFIHYGLGNFLFDQGWWAGARFFLDELYVYDGKLQFVDVYTGIIDELARPRLMTPDERENFLFVLFDQFGSF
jgi:poly-gamma-glutamate synthesis protein (capsule biosynthesis protein)